MQMRGQTLTPGWRPNRRTLLRSAGLAGAGLIGTGAVGAGFAASDTLRTDDRQSREDPRFTIAVIPDTQFLFDADRGDPAPLAASLDYLVAHRDSDNIVFVAHLGDIVQNAAAGELREAGRVFGALDAAGLPYSVLAGNHDIDSATDDQRGSSPYLDVFGPRRFARSPTFGGATPDGYNTYHLFRAAGRTLLLLALDWRPSDRTLAWARQVLAGHPRTPVIMTTHELVTADLDGAVTLPAHGQRLWDELIREHDQIFLTVNGHFWPAGRTVLRNAAGNDVHVHVTNYQNRYYGGSGTIRLYRFDTARDTIDVRTLSPWILAQPPAARNAVAAREIELTDPQNAFTVPIDFVERFAGFAPPPVPPSRPARTVLPAGTVAYWRFDRAGRSVQAGAAVAGGGRVEDLSGHGNHLTRVTPEGSGPDALTWSTEHHGHAPGPGSLRFAAAPAPAPGAYLRTVPDAPLNAMTFAGGYTIEAYAKLPADARTGHGMGVLSRLGTGADAGLRGTDPGSPLATLGVAEDLTLRWAVFPTRRDAISTNWSHELPVDEWFHVAVVNDGGTTTMYVDGAPVLRNPRTPAVGLTSVGRPWLVGATHRGGAVAQFFRGWIGDLRIVNRPLPRRLFLT